MTVKKTLKCFQYWYIVNLVLLENISPFNSITFPFMTFSKNNRCWLLHFEITKLILILNGYTYDQVKITNKVFLLLILAFKAQKESSERPKKELSVKQSSNLITSDDIPDSDNLVYTFKAVLFINLTVKKYL